MAVNGLAFAAYAPALAAKAGATRSGIAAAALVGVSFPLWFYSLVLFLDSDRRGWPTPPAYGSAAFWSTVGVAALLARATRRPFTMLAAAIAAVIAATLLGGGTSLVGAPFGWHLAMFLGLVAAAPRAPRLPVENGRCTACGYSLDGLPDSNAVCPECGAWIRSEQAPAASSSEVSGPASLS